MSDVNATAGNARIWAHADGWPIWVDLVVSGINGAEVEVRVSTNDLHDLRYCIDRVLAQLGDRVR